MKVTKTHETDHDVTIAFEPPVRSEAFELTVDGSTLLQDGKRHFFYDASKPRRIGKVLDGKPHQYGVRALGLLDSGDVTVPAPPDTGLPVLDLFRAVVEPHNHELADDDYSGAWAYFTSPATPTLAPNHSGARGRIMPAGWHGYFLDYRCREYGYVGREQNNHSMAESNGWPVDGISPVARDEYSRRGDSGSFIEYVLEYERDHDTDSTPHSGGAHFGLPDIYSQVGYEAWLLHEMKLGANKDGLLRVWDWKTGKLLVEAVGVNTLAPSQHWLEQWVGGYDSKSAGLAGAGSMIHAPALFGSTIEEMLKDVPQVSAPFWHTTPKASGAQPSRIDWGIGRIQVPDSPLRAAA